MAPTAMATIAPVDSSCEVESDSELPCDASGGGGDGEGGDGEGGGGEGGGGGDGGADGGNLALLSDGGQREARWGTKG